MTNFFNNFFKDHFNNFFNYQFIGSELSLIVYTGICYLLGCPYGDVFRFAHASKKM